MTHAFALLSTLFGLAGVALSANCAAPQLVKLLRTRRTGGLSSSTVAFTCISSVAWGSYGLLHGSVLLAVSSTLVLSAQLPTLVLLAREGVWPMRSRCIAASLAGAYILVALAGGWAALTAVLITHVVIQYTPQVMTVMRSADLGGVSETSARMLLATGSAWGLSGLFGGQVPLVSWGLIVSAAATITLLRLRGAMPALAPA